MKKIVAVVGVAGLALALAACAAGTPEAARAAHEGFLSQLVLGFWHGLIAPLTLLVEVIRRFAPNVLPWPWRLYAVDGSSVAYDIGFYFGLAGGPAFLWSRRRWR
ncbi:MAG: hypothetical protein ACR2FH_11425 [Caulobacteraceae bacterium]